MKYNSVAHAIDDLSKGKSIIIIDDQNEKKLRVLSRAELLSLIISQSSCVG